MQLPLSIVLLASLIFYPAASTLVNVSIDDTFGDEETGNHIQYSPDGAWLPNGCTGCNTVVDSTSAFRGTWHYALFTPPTDGSAAQPVSATVQFTGTS